MSKARNKSLESYAHKMAKEVVAAWLRELAAKGCAAESGNPGIDFGDLYWRVNRSAPHFGIWLEYPIGRRGDVCGSRDGLDPVWDEAHWVRPELGSRWVDRPPTFDELIGIGRPPEYILDVAVQHKGAIVAAIEVVHKHPPSAEKLSALRSLEIKTSVVPAHWILGQVRLPDAIPSEFWVS